MPYQNRVTPEGELITVSARGTLMGNRGTLHNSSGEIIKKTDRKAWIYCALEYKGRKQDIMAPGRYTQLFFLDEATALAAGHRPCATCQRSHYNAFTDLFKRSAEVDSISAIDNTLKQQRGGLEVEMKLKSVPDGAFIRLSSTDTATWLVWDRRLFRWSPSGYCEERHAAIDTTVNVVTPSSSLEVLVRGYVPRVHLSVKALVVDLPWDKPKEVTERKEHSRNNSDQSAYREPTSDELTNASTDEDSFGVGVQNNNGPSFKLKTTPRGKELYAYFAAILTETGMDQGDVADLKKYLGNFKGHLDAGRIVKVNGGFQLTSDGREYFADRFKRGNSQYIDPILYKSMRKKIREGGNDCERLKGI